MNGWKGRQTVRQMELRGEINNASGGVSEEEKEKEREIIIKREKGKEKRSGEGFECPGRRDR